VASLSLFHQLLASLIFLVLRLFPRLLHLTRMLLALVLVFLTSAAVLCSRLRMVLVVRIAFVARVR
jgi:hypothetical protein